ncbi:uncharacterized protein ELE39_002808 [Cryptosporidium sp. chipmunk genotype I]|uniref:uncharacterized protein n=1 Tax=Cryptosporidium sp. chipmunk genotype I TaxID=1280935 RepID=UPI00351A9FA2|nr:hypothetical protein ELE39_002808 [Cryptosporidium sp. chipmunk genotype I]
MIFKTKNQSKISQKRPDLKANPGKCNNQIEVSKDMVNSTDEKFINRKRYVFILLIIIISLFSWLLFINKQEFLVYLISLKEKINLFANKYITSFEMFQNYKLSSLNRNSVKTLIGKIYKFLNNIYLTSKNVQIFINNRLSLVYIWTKYIINLSVSNIKFEYKKLSRKYQIIMLMHTIIHRATQITLDKCFNLIQSVQFFITNSSNYTFYFTTLSTLVINVIIWENIIMKNIFEDYKLNNLKIVTSTISSLLTVFYLSNIERLTGHFIGKYYNYIYGFCSRAFLNSDANQNKEFGDHNIKEFTFISSEWWKIHKFESLFKGVEIINEIKKKSQPQINEINNKVSMLNFEIFTKFKYKGQISKDICNFLISGNQEIRIISRVLIFSMSTLSVTYVLYCENKRINTNKNITSHSKIYTFFTVISGLIIPILLNNIQKFSAYKEQGQVIFILLFLSLKLLTNHKHFLMLIFELINSIKSKFISENNFEKIILQSQDRELFPEEIKDIQNSLTQINESSSLTRERNKKTSLLLKSTKSYSNSTSENKYKNIKNHSNQRKKSSSRDLNRSRIKHLKDVIRTRITSKNGIQEMFDNATDMQSSQEKKSYTSFISKTIQIFKHIIIFIKDMIFNVFNEKILGSLLYLIFKDCRGLVLSSFDHYKINKYIQESKISMELKEELLKSMTLCYTNIGNPQVIRSINLAKKDLIQDLENLKMVLPNTLVMEKLKSIQNMSSLSQVEAILQPFSGINSLEEKINVEIQYYLILNSINILSDSCETIKESCKAIINSESLIELINNITNHDLEKINLLLNSNMDYNIISNIIKSVVLMNDNKTSIWSRFSLITNSISKVHLELVCKLNKLKDIEINEIFIQWNILRAGLKYILNQIKNNRKSYEDIYMGGLPLHTLQMALHYLNTSARKTSDLVQESIIACSEFCLYFNLKTIEELHELNKSSLGQSKLFELCKRDCNDILRLIQTIKTVLEELCENKIRIDGKEIDISYLSSMLPAVVLNSEHKCCRKETESNCKLHGKGLHEAFRLYAEGNFPAVTNNIQPAQSKKEPSKFIPERPRSSIPREASSNKESNLSINPEEKTRINYSGNSNHNNEAFSNQTGLRRPKEIMKKEGINSNEENLPFLPSTPD